MGPVSIFLLAVAAIFLIGILGEIVFERTGVPDVVWLILVGIVLGPVSGLVAKHQLEAIAPYFGAVTLVVVLFDGGSELRLDELSRSAVRSSVLAISSFALAVCVVAVTSMGAAALGLLPSSWSWIDAVILGAILGGSSSVVIMPALHKAGLAPSLANLVNLESALTDVLCVVVTVACVKIAVTGVADVGRSAVMLVKSFGIGLGVGVVAGLIAILFLRRIKRSSYAYPLVLGVLLVLYAMIDEMGGSAALGILAAAVMIGNAPALSKVVGLVKTASLGRGVQKAHDEITFIIKSFFFTFIGAMLSPPWGMLLFGVLLGVLLLLARVPAVALGTWRGSFPTPAKGLIAVSMPRGMAAGVLAMLPAQEHLPGTRDLPVVVFAAVFTTILVFAIGFPLMKRRLGPESLATPCPHPGAGDALASVSAGGFRDDVLSDAPAVVPAVAAGAGDRGAPPDTTDRVIGGGATEVPAGAGARVAPGSLDPTVADGITAQLEGQSADATTVDQAIPLTHHEPDD